VKSFTKHFRDEFQYHIDHKHCLVRPMSEARPLLNLEIDGRPLQVKPGSTVIEAAHSLGIYVPHFCYHKKLSIAANCRMCLVQVEKAPKPLPACATPSPKA